MKEGCAPDMLFLTDLAEMDDELSRRLVEYFRKNFDFDLEYLKQNQINNS